MPQDKSEIRAAYPLPVYNYRVTIGENTLGFSEVSGLSLEYEPVHYRHGLSFAMGGKIIPGKPKPVMLTLKKGIMQGKDFLSAWLQDTYADPSKDTKQNVLIDLCDQDGLPIVRWSVQGALPVKLEAPGFNANSNDVAVETLELVAHDIQVNYDPG
jgi:phage tail-like protein